MQEVVCMSLPVVCSSPPRSLGAVRKARVFCKRATQRDSHRGAHGAIISVEAGCLVLMEN